VVLEEVPERGVLLFLEVFLPQVIALEFTTKHAATLTHDAVGCGASQKNLFDLFKQSVLGA